MKQAVLSSAALPAVELASLRRRLACMFYEGLPTFAVWAVLWFAPMVALGFLGVDHQAIPAWLTGGSLLLVLGGYFVFVWYKMGQTLAMQTWRVQVVDAHTGKPPSLQQCIIRYLAAWPSLLWLACGAGIVWAAFVDRDRQFLHDRLAGTCVIFDPPRRAQSN